jgi:23S rRNA (cytosine1962-C5)-methyltransferase
MIDSEPLRHACQLSRKGYLWARTLHPWVYRDDLSSLSGEHGDIVRVLFEGRCLGSAFLGSRSKIALRWIERSSAPRVPERAFWQARLEKALARRSALAAKTNALRIVHDVADGFPGLVIDRYGAVAVLQATTAGSERLLPLLTELLVEVAGAGSVVARNDLGVREAEGLPREVRILAGAPPERIWVLEEGPRGSIEYPVDPLRGQKTGAFLDQRENRWAAAILARGRMLDAFSSFGLFALHAARGVDEALAVDTSGPSLESCSEAAARNGLGNIRTLEKNVFEYLKEACAGGERFQTIVLDPPAFAKSRKDVPAARRGYKEINRRAMSLLDPGGVLVTCSCSYNLSERDFLDVLREAAADARGDFRVLERRTQSGDHPTLLCHPESSYLKCAILEKA